MINILYIIDNLHYGGTERQLVELIRNLDRNRFQPHLCTLKPSNSLFDELDIPKLYLDFSSFCHPSLFGKLKKLSGFIRKHRIDIVQTFFQDPFLLAAMVKPFHQFKLIGSFRDMGFWRDTSETWKMRSAYPFFDGFIANSEAVKQHFVQCDGIAPEKIRVIYNGFDMAAVDNCPRGDVVSEGGPVVGIVANLNRPVKRVEDFVEAAALVHAQRPDARFVVVGDGHLRDELKKLARERSIEDVVVFTGRIANPLGVVQGFTVGVITSETEGFCNAIIEYMACGVPVVATKTGGNPELVEDGKNGFLVSIANPEELSDKILALLEDQALYSTVSQHNKGNIQRRFNWQVAIELHNRFYEKCLYNRC